MELNVTFFSKSLWTYDASMKRKASYTFHINPNLIYQNIKLENESKIYIHSLNNLMTCKWLFLECLDYYCFCFCFRSCFDSKLVSSWTQRNDLTHFCSTMTTSLFILDIMQIQEYISQKHKYKTIQNIYKIAINEDVLISCFDFFFG